MTVRMKDIAKDLGLSIITISKVLRNHPDIAEKTRQRVLRRVEELDYQPSVLARSLVTGRSYLIGLVVPDLLHPFFAEIAKALSIVVAKRGYSLIISSSEENPLLEAREIQQLLARQLDALVIAPCGNETHPYERMDRNGQPYVLIDRELSGLAANFVGIDDEAAGRLATEHLIDQGCRTVAHIRGMNNSPGVRRLEGYRKVLLSRGMQYSEALVVAGLTVDVESTRQGAKAMGLLLKQRTRPDGVFCFNDPLAIGAMNAIVEAGLRIPEDIAVIGCGNLHYDNSLRVPLSSIDQHSQLIGERAGSILLSMIGSKTRLQPITVILDPALVVRSSTMKKPLSVRSGAPSHSKSDSAKANVAKRKKNLRCAPKDKTARDKLLRVLDPMSRANRH
jgi:LacI family transcriptional regulator